MSIEIARARIQETKKHRSTKLDLSGLKLRFVPKEIAQLKTLRSLKLGYNQLRTLPVEIGQLTNLISLDLRSNQLSSLPTEIGQLKNLTLLDLSSNRLTNLPTEIGQLRKLQGLLLALNKLESLPIGIVHLRHLKITFNNTFSKTGGIVNLYSNNNLEHPPFEVLQQGWKAVENYFKQFEEQSSDKLYEAKLVLIGEGRTGKTSLMKALMKEGFNPQEGSTHGINVRSMLHTPEETGLDRDFRLNLWDFGGQDIYKDTHRFFLTKDTIYILVTENRKVINFDDIYYWLHSIARFAPNAPVLLVQNKCEADMEDISFQDYKRKFKNLVPWSNLIRTSCVDGYENTIQELKRSIIRVITDDDLKPSVGDDIPAKWVDVRQDVFKQQETNVMVESYTNFEKQCAKYDLLPQDVKTLAGYFFRIGVFTHYVKNPLLRRTVFLNNEWLTKGVYKIIDDPSIKEQRGRFNRENIVSMYQGTTYENQEAEFIELMKEFKICYELDSGNYITPLRLPADIPAEVNLREWQLKDTLHFAFDYQDFMPRGILSTFIIDINEYIDSNIVWLHGVVLKGDGNNRALVQEDKEKEQIDIYVRGRDKRAFLMVLTRSFQKIHSELNDLPHKGKLACICSVCSSPEGIPFFHDADIIFRRLFERTNPIAICGNSDEVIDVAKLAGELVVMPEVMNETAIDELRTTIFNFGGIKIAKNDFNFEQEAQGVFGGDNNSGNSFHQQIQKQKQIPKITVDPVLLATELDKLSGALINQLVSNPLDVETPQSIAIVNQAKKELEAGESNQAASTLKKGGQFLFQFAQNVDVNAVTNIIQEK